MQLDYLLARRACDLLKSQVDQLELKYFNKLCGLGDYPEALLPSDIVAATREQLDLDGSDGLFNKVLLRCTNACNLPGLPAEMSRTDETSETAQARNPARLLAALQALLSGHQSMDQIASTELLNEALEVDVPRQHEEQQQRQQRQRVQSAAIQMSIMGWLDNLEYMDDIEEAVQKALQTSNPPVVLSRFPGLSSALMAHLPAALQAAGNASRIKADLQSHFEAIQSRLQPCNEHAAAPQDLAILALLELYDLPTCLFMLTAQSVMHTFEAFIKEAQDMPGLTAWMLPDDFRLVEAPRSSTMRTAFQRQFSISCSAKTILKKIGQICIYASLMHIHWDLHLRHCRSIMHDSDFQKCPHLGEYRPLLQPFLGRPESGQAVVNQRLVH